MKIAIEHRTAWHVAAHGGILTQLLRMTPRSNPRQQVLAWDLDLPGHASRGTDAFGNVQHLLSVDPGREDLALTARGVVEIRPQAEDLPEPLSPLLFLRSTPLTHADLELLGFADNFRIPNPSRDVLRALMVAVGSAVALAPATAFAGHDAARVFADRRGSVHDLVHVFVSCARLLGVPARFVSGYAHTGGSSASHLAGHAWAEAFVHGHWHTFDIANRLDRPTTHLTLAIGMDYLDACPVRGIHFGSAREHLSAQALIEQAQQANQ